MHRTSAILWDAMVYIHRCVKMWENIHIVAESLYAKSAMTNDMDLHYQGATNRECGSEPKQIYGHLLSIDLT